MSGDRYQCISDDVVLGVGVKIYSFVNLYGCQIGDYTRIGTFVEVQRGVRIGRMCKIQSHSFICEGVEVEDGVFVGHNVNFINDRVPRATVASGDLKGDQDWTLERTIVRRGASIGTGALIMGGVEIGERAIVGAGAVVTKDVLAESVVAGVPARLIRSVASGE